jgi:DNA (cytosine-5)-methyltransferase 1
VEWINGLDYAGIDLLSGGVPCQPFSVAGKRLGSEDERDLFPEALRLVVEARPRAVMLENVPGLGHDDFEPYRESIVSTLRSLGYWVQWDRIVASDHDVPQFRPRLSLVAILQAWAYGFHWPVPSTSPAPTVGNVLYDLMAAEGWKGADKWRQGAQRVGWTLSGGAKTGGGPDLGPTRAKESWPLIGVNPKGIADGPPGVTGSQPRGQGKFIDANETGPMLTVPMAALLQGFTPDYEFIGGKTSQYRQVSHAFPPPCARALGESIAAALDKPSNFG